MYLCIELKKGKPKTLNRVGNFLNLFNMKKVFGILMLLFLMVGVSIATNQVVDNPDSGINQMVILQTDFYVEPTPEQTLTFIETWVGDNFSSEGVVGGVVIGDLGLMSYNYKDNIIRVYTNKDYKIEFIQTKTNLSLKIYTEHIGKIDDVDGILSTRITKQFRADLIKWLYQLE